MTVIIAVDGTAASGKGTLAKRLARHFNFAHMDSGALYRLTALAVLDNKSDPANEADALNGARAIDLTRIADPAIRSDVVGRYASQVAAIPAVRAVLHDFQTSFLASPPGQSLGAVMDGRDIGTVIAPDATAKLFVDATPRFGPIAAGWSSKSMGIAKDEAELLAELAARDARDGSRAVSPMKKAADAFLLDTTELDIDAAFAAALALVSPKIEDALKDRPRG